VLQLLVMRHGKSDWKASSVDDHERPLARRGVEAARWMGALIAELDMVPDLVLASTAVRALDTARLAALGGSWSSPVEPRRELYGQDVSGVLEIIACAQDIKRLMVVGHEPTFSGLVSELVGGARIRLPTAAVACVEIDAGGWAEIAAGRSQLLWLAVPKLVAAARRVDRG
jgi:phosphohistidine phosphatase